MLLNKIKIKGFKSFANEVELNLERGITAVVGPNGCGKSNIADSINWALGEQSPTSLRGKKMDQMIFNGSSSRKAMGMAEVTLTLKPPKEIDQYLDFDDEDIEGLERKGADLMELIKGIEKEIEITRRMFRDGHSEYRLNGKTCRLKDIQDLLMALGIGTRGITIIEQDRIQSMISAKPVDRRAIIEDAAGITKFKVNKHLTNLKLSHAETNLSRINDVIGEQKTIVNSLGRQAAKARRFKQYQADVRAIEKHMIKHRHSELMRQHSQVTERLNEKKRAHAGQFAEFEKVEARLAELRQSIDELTQEKSRKRESFYKANLELDRQNNRLKYLRETIEDMQKRMAEATGRMEKDKQNATETKERISTIEETLARFAEKGAEHEKKLADASAALAQENEELNRLRTERDKEFVSLSAIREERAGVTSSLESLKREKEHLAASLGKVTNNIEKTKLDIQENENRIRQHTQRDEELDAKTGELERANERLNDYREALREELEAVDRRIQSISESHTSAAARLATLREVEEKREDITESVRAILTDRSISNQIGAMGVVADFIEIDEPMIVPVAIAYASLLEGVVLRNSGQAEQAIALLKEKQLGRAAFVCLDDCEERSGQQPGADDLRNYITAKNETGERLLRLFPAALHARSLDDALAASNMRPETPVATTNGELALAGAVIHGGGETAGQKMFSRRRQMEELAGRLEHLAGEVEQYKQKRLGIQEKNLGFKEEMKENRALIEKLQMQRVELKSQLQALNQQIERGQKAIVEYEQEISRLDAVRESIDQSLEEKASDASRISERVEELEEKIAAFDSQLMEKSEELEQLKRSEATARAELQQHGDSRKAHENRLQAHTFELNELRRRMEFDQEEVEKLEQQKTFNIHEINSIEKSLREDAERNKEISGELSSLDARLDELQTEHKEYAGRVRSMKSALETVNEDIDSLKYKSQELGMALEHLFERAKENLNLSKEDVDKLEMPDLDLTVDECMDELARLKEKIASIGAVNLLAEEEYEKHKERHDNLLQQKDDVESSIDSLQRVISRIDSISRQRFKEAFEKINDNFHKIFRILFQGGRAELILTEGDLLEAGIEIMVQPPGKRNQSATLLSGGEKTISAFALILAVMEYRPTPFCILDESDAALDESNIRRIASLIRERSDYTQFIVVTHNKTTMEIADRLYGVTMDEPGVSQVVSVQFN